MHVKVSGLQKGDRGVGGMFLIGIGENRDL